MLLSLIHLKGRQLKTHHGGAGRIGDFYVNDLGWFIEFFTTDTGARYCARNIYVSPVEFNGKPKWSGDIALMNRVKKSKELLGGGGSRKTVSQKNAAEFKHCYHWPNRTKTHPEKPSISGIFYEIDEESLVEVSEEKTANLHSDEEMRNCQIRAVDGDVGQIIDFIVDDGSWKVLFIVIGMRNLFPGDEMLIEPTDISRIQWSSREIFIDLAKKQVVHHQQ